MSKLNPGANHARIVSGISESYPSQGRGPSQPNRNTNANTPVKHLPAVQFGDMHNATDKIVNAASARVPKPAKVNPGRREPGQVSASLPPVRGTAAAPVVGPDVKAPKR